MSNEIDAKKIDEKFGPPSYLETLLEDIGSKKGKIVEGLTSFLTLPYVNALKVQDRSGKDVSLYEQVLSLKSRYEDLQERSIPIVKQISAYGRLSQSLLPVVEKDGQITLDQFLQVNTALVMRYGQESKAIAKETDTLKQEFADLLDLLETNLGEIVKKIAEQENALHEAEKEYAFEKANAIISGVITICFLIGAGVALCLGAAPVAIEIGVHAGVALYETIKAAIKASDLASVISNLKSGIESAKATKAQLEFLIPKLAEIVKMFSEIGQAWDSMTEGLSEVKDDYLAWSNPKLFTPEMLSMALESWDKVIRGVDLYVSTIHGIEPAPTDNPNALMAKRVAAFKAGNSLPERHDVKAHTVVANLALTDTGRNLCRDIFSAPPVKGMFPQESDVQNIANNYAQAATSLQQAGLPDIASTCNAIQQALSDKVIPSQNDALMSLRKFAEKQPDVPIFPIQQAEWDNFCNVRMAAVKDGRVKVDACYNSIHNVQNATSNLQDSLTARVEELHITLRNLEQSIREAEDEKERQMRDPFGILSGLIQELIGKITGMYEERGRRYGELNCLQESTQRAEDCLRNVTNLGSSTGTIDKIWDSMQTQMINAADVWPVLHEVKMSDLEVDLYKTTWNAVRVSLGS